MALPSAYAAMRALTPDDTLVLDGTVGGIGGCPYCGTGRATGMMATEDLFHMLEGMGIETGVDVSKLIDCAWLLEEIIGRPVFGAVSKAGPRPMSYGDVVRSRTCPSWRRSEQAKHFKLGPGSYEGGIYPMARTGPQSPAPQYVVVGRVSERVFDESPKPFVVSFRTVNGGSTLDRHGVTAPYRIRG